MKRIFKLALSLLISSSVISLAACNIHFFTVDKKDFSVYSLINEGEGGKDISSYKKEDISALIVDKQEHVPYLTIENYNSMLLPFKKDGYEFIVSDVGGSSIWAVSHNKEYFFLADFEQSSKTIMVSGNAESALTTAKDYSKSSLYLGVNFESSIVSGGSNPITYYYKDIPYRVFVHDNKTYLPLSLLDIVISPFTGIHHYYSYKNIYQYVEDEELTTVEFINNDKTYTAFSEADEIIKNDLITMPEYVREDRYNAFLFIFENIYGLKTTRHIKSMITEFEKEGLLEDFLSEDSDKRNKAFASVFAYLDDGHTGVTDSYANPWSTGAQNSMGPNLMNMVKVATQLHVARATFYNSIEQEQNTTVYLSDEVAYLPFNEFKFAMNGYKEDGSIRDDLELEDSFFFVAKSLEEIKGKGGIKKVILDISTNGGGTVGVMMKMLSLLSKDNKSSISFKIDSAEVIEKDIASVDSNLDGEYDLNDVYGDDFDFYLLTSCYSFSCGNALPFLAQKQGIAHIIGQNSGGGECAVEEAYLPTGEYFVHSSLTHIGYYENETFYGSEVGAKAEKLIDYENYFDIPTLLSSLSI